MAVECGISTGVGLTCQTRKDAAGGIKTKIWLFNVSDVSSLTTDGNGFVTAINFEAYKGLIEFTGDFNANNATSDMTRTDGGNASFPHSLVMTLYDVTPAHKAALEDLTYANGVAAIVETSQERFEMYGWSLGMVVESGPRSTGQSPADSTARVVTLSGPQSLLEKIVFDTDYATTKALLESYVVA